VKEGRRGTRPRHVALTLVIALSLTLGPATTAAPAGEPAPQQEYDEVLAEEQELVDQLEQIEQQATDLAAELDGVEADLVAAQQTLERAAAAEAEARREARRQSDLERAAAAEVAEARDRLAQQAVAAYVAGTGDSLAGAILRAESSLEVEDAIVYSQVVVNDTDATVNRLVAAETRQRDSARAAREAKQRAAAERDAAEEATATLTAARDQRVALKFAVEARLAEQAEKVEEIKTRKVVLQTRIIAQNHASDGVSQLLAAVQAGQPAWQDGTVLLTTPVPGHRVGSPFGMRHHPILNIDRLHAGCDIGAPTGTPIYAPGDGIVVFAGERGGYGNATVIDHGHQLGTVYGHQSRIVVTEGDVVRRGDLIGYVGSTGLSTGPHLHFETRLLGVPVDPVTIVDFDAAVPYGS